MEKPKRTLTVIDRLTEAEGVISLHLADAASVPLPTWMPGAHIEVELETPDGELMSRHYSLCSDPHDLKSWRIGIRNDTGGRGGSAWLHENAKLGTEVRCSAPRNHFPLEPATRYRFIAGGIGITPILPMLQRAEQEGIDWTLLYRGRSRESMAFLDELAEYGDRVQVSARSEVGDCRLSDHLDAVGDGEAVYACGPSSMLQQLDLEAQRLPPGALHVEHFTPRESDTASDSVFRVEFAASGITASVSPGTSVLDVAEAHGIQVFTSCREGTCGTCETPIIGGEAEHRDTVLSTAEQVEQSCMMICVSRAAPGCPLLRLDL